MISNITPRTSSVLYDFEYTGQLEVRNFDIQQFQEGLNLHNQRICDAAAQIFNQEFEADEDMKDACISFTGSDGRNEKISPQESHIELILITKKTSTASVRLAEKIQQLINKNPYMFHDTLEIKSLDKDRVSTFVRETSDGSKEERAFPTRALDAKYLAGNHSILAHYKETFFQELQDPALKKVLKGFTSSAVKPSLSLLKKASTGIDGSHVDIKTDTIHFDGKRIKATKYPLLRAVQYKIADYLCKQVKEKNLDKETFLAMPFSTIDRIQWLRDNHLIQLSSEKMELIQKAYAASLYWFGKAQTSFAYEKITQITLPKGQAKEIADTIQDLVFGKNWERTP